MQAGYVRQKPSSNENGGGALVASYMVLRTPKRGVHQREVTFHTGKINSSGGFAGFLTIYEHLQLDVAVRRDPDEMTANVCKD